MVDFTPEIALQQLTAGVVSDRHARALYFNNLGVEELIAAEHGQALIYFKNALFLDPELAIAWNNIGATYIRLNNGQFAEYSYRMAFDIDATSATAVNNLARYYRTVGEMDTAEVYETAIARFNQRIPYFHFARGNLDYTNNDLPGALTVFQRALRLKKQEPDFYLALARVYYDMGDLVEAKKMRDSADELLAKNGFIYRTSDLKVRIIESGTILSPSSPGISIVVPTGRPRRSIERVR